MVRGNERLTETTIKGWAKSAKPGQKLFDGRGLHLAKLPSGATTWRLKYLFDGKERLYSIGDVSLAEARQERDRVRKLLGAGHDPVQERLIVRARNVEASKTTFAEVTGEWLKKQRPAWSTIHFTKSERALERDVLPKLGKLPVSRIEPSMVAGVIEAIQTRGVRDTALKVLQHVRAIFDYGIGQGYRNDNPAEAVDEIIAPPQRVKHRPALLDFPSLGSVLRRMEAANVTPAVRLCHHLLAYTGVRIQNAVQARWHDFKLNAEVPMWVIPREHMKVKSREYPHRVILPRQIVEKLLAWRDAQRAAEYKGEFLFPGGDDGHVSREAIEKALRVTLMLRDKHTAHGWRAALRTLAEESGENFDDEAILLALDHEARDKVARAYDRGERLKERIRLAQWWGDQLDRAARGPENVLPFERKAAA